MITLLLIEDNNDIRENTIEILELYRYHVLSAHNGRHGLAMAKEHLPDAIICDLMMPELNGYEVLEALKADSETAIIPFIFLTASVEKTAIQKGLELGAMRYIRKPFETSELLQAVEDVLR